MGGNMGKTLGAAAIALIVCVTIAFVVQDEEDRARAELVRRRQVAQAVAEYTPLFAKDETGFQVQVCLEPASGQTGPFFYSRFSGPDATWVNEELVALVDGQFCQTFVILTKKTIWELRLDLQRGRSVGKLYGRYRRVRDGQAGSWTADQVVTRYMGGFHKLWLYAPP